MKFKDRLASLGFDSYEAYLKSPHWEDFKERYRISGLPRQCLVCDCSQIDLHHHAYNRLGAERLRDVTPLCREHHELVHRILAENNWFVDATAKALEIIKATVKPVARKARPVVMVKVHSARKPEPKKTKAKKVNKEDRRLHESLAKKKSDEDLLTAYNAFYASLRERGIRPPFGKLKKIAS